MRVIIIDSRSGKVYPFTACKTLFSIAFCSHRNQYCKHGFVLLKYVKANYDLHMCDLFIARSRAYDNSKHHRECNKYNRSTIEFTIHI